MTRRALFILGMHRSGTSLAAGLARLAGVDLGHNVLVGEAVENPRGFWEHEDVLAIDEELLAALSLAWNVPAPLPTGWLDHPRVGPLAERARGVLVGEFATATAWGIKDPRLCRLWPLWEQAAAAVADEVHYLHVFRHPLEVADSLWARNRIPAEQALLTWLFYNLEAVRAQAGGRLVSVPFRRLIDEAPGCVSMLRGRLGMTAQLPTEMQRQIAEFVGPALVHHRTAGRDPRLDTDAGRLAAACHATLERLAAGDTAVGPELETLAGGLEELGRDRRRARRAKAVPVDVIVPVHRGREATLACLAAVLAAGGDHELVVIDDASPEPELSAALRERAARGAFTLLENRTNLGFVASANRGMQLHPDRDVVLLNADTLVPPGWLERLRAAAEGDFVGAVTPFSNNATLASYPVPFADNPLPAGWTTAELDALFREANAGWHIDVPTAVGFCMYVRRDCLEDVGPFEESLFGRGYGEETDFSMRAASRGWRNVLAADLFVFHRGRVSFGAEADALQRRAGEVMRQRHPAYEAAIARFRQGDPLAPARDAVSAARVRQRGLAEVHHVLAERRWAEAARRTEADAFRHEVSRLDRALGEAQSIVTAREAEVRRLSDGLADAQRLADERLAEIRTLHSALADATKIAAERLDELRTLHTALAEAQRLAGERLAEIRSRDAALTEAQTLANQRADEIIRLDGGLTEAQRLAGERLAEIRSRDAALAEAQTLAAERLRHIREYDTALAEATRLAAERLDDGRMLDAALAEARGLADERLRQIHALDAALADASRLAVERLSALEALDRRLGDTAAALAASEHMARERLAQVEDLCRKLQGFTSGAPAEERCA